MSLPPRLVQCDLFDFPQFRTMLPGKKRQMPQWIVVIGNPRIAVEAHVANRIRMPTHFFRAAGLGKGLRCRFILQRNQFENHPAPEQKIAPIR